MAEDRSKEGPILETRKLCVRVGRGFLLRDIDLHIQPHKVFGIIGPSGAGKSTLLKSLNRLVELIPGLSVEGGIFLDGGSILGPTVDVDLLRRRIGILFQQPVIFPQSIFKNVIFGVRRTGRLERKDWTDRGEQALREAALWDEVKDRLDAPAHQLSAGQQQRLCLARALASNPEVILMDEPTSALDPRSTEAIECLIAALNVRHTIVLVTHNVGQARRLADDLACICSKEGTGEVVEQGPAERLLRAPRSRDLTDYLNYQAAV